MGQNQHIGVQLSAGSQLVEPQAAQDYLESYFGDDKVNIYWSSTEAFLSEYCQQTGLKP
jgi:hypothetical protein